MADDLLTKVKWGVSPSIRKFSGAVTGLSLKTVMLAKFASIRKRKERGRKSDSCAFEFLPT